MMMQRRPHFTQAAGRPVFTCQGTGELTCPCRQSVLVAGYDPANFLAVDFQCAACGVMTTTPGLSALRNPPAVVVTLERTGETPPEGAAIPPGRVLAGREELDRLMAIYQPRGPVSDTVTISDVFLESLSADYDRLTGGALNADLAEVAALESRRPLAGMLKHRLAWAIQTLRAGIRDPEWRCSGTDVASVATTLAGAFRYFTDCWSHHPLFPEMLAAAADTGFSLHGTALFAAAKCLSDAGNRVAFVPPRDSTLRLRDFAIAMGPADKLTCVMDVFDTFEWPTGRREWDFPMLREAVLDRLAASKGRIHQKNPGMIVLSPGPVRAAMEQPLVDAIITAFHSHGKRHRHVSAMSVILAKFLPTEARDTVRFGYSFLPVSNPRHVAVTMRVATGPG